MSTGLEEFIEKFKVEQLRIASTDYWTWSLRPTHSTLGAGVLSLNRFVTNLADITEAESTDLRSIVNIIDSRLKSAWTPDKMNYIALMMVDDHLHFHVMPRYASPRSFAGRDWVDGGWPALPNLGENAELADDPVLFEIRDALAR